MDYLEKDWGGLNATDALLPGASTEQRWLSQEPHWLNSTRANNTHWASLAPQIHSATTTIPGQDFPTHEWTNVMPPSLEDIYGVSAQQFRCTAPAPFGAPVGPLPVNPDFPVWSTAGHTPMAPGGYTDDGASGYIGTGVDVYAHNGWQSPSLTATINASSAHHSAEDLWSHTCSMAAGGSTRTSSSSAQQVLEEQLLMHAAVGEERHYRGMSGSSASDMSGPEGVSDRWTERNASSFH